MRGLGDFWAVKKKNKEREGKEGSCGAYSALSGTPRKALGGGSKCSSETIPSSYRGREALTPKHGGGFWGWCHRWRRQVASAVGRCKAGIADLGGSTCPRWESRPPLKPTVLSPPVSLATTGESCLDHRHLTLPTLLPPTLASRRGTSRTFALAPSRPFPPPTLHKYQMADGARHCLPESSRCSPTAPSSPSRFLLTSSFCEAAVHSVLFPSAASVFTHRPPSFPAIPLHPSTGQPGSRFF